MAGTDEATAPALGDVFISMDSSEATKKVAKLFSHIPALQLPASWPPAPPEFCSNAAEWVADAHLCARGIGDVNDFTRKSSKSIPGLLRLFCQHVTPDMLDAARSIAKPTKPTASRAPALRVTWHPIECMSADEFFGATHARFRTAVVCGHSAASAIGSVAFAKLMSHFESLEMQQRPRLIIIVGCNAGAPRLGQLLMATHRGLDIITVCFDRIVAAQDVCNLSRALPLLKSLLDSPVAAALSERVWVKYAIVAALTAPEIAAAKPRDRKKMDVPTHCDIHIPGTMLIFNDRCGYDSTLRKALRLSARMLKCGLYAEAVEMERFAALHLWFCNKLGERDTLAFLRNISTQLNLIPLLAAAAPDDHSEHGAVLGGSSAAEADVSEAARTVAKSALAPFADASVSLGDDELTDEFSTAGATERAVSGPTVLPTTSGAPAAGAGSAGGTAEPSIAVCECPAAGVTELLRRSGEATHFFVLEDRIAALWTHHLTAEAFGHLASGAWDDLSHVDLAAGLVQGYRACSLEVAVAHLWQRYQQTRTSARVIASLISTAIVAICEDAFLKHSLLGTAEEADALVLTEKYQRGPSAVSESPGCFPAAGLTLLPDVFPFCGVGSGGWAHIGIAEVVRPAGAGAGVGVAEPSVTIGSHRSLNIPKGGLYANDAQLSPALRPTYDFTQADLKRVLEQLMVNLFHVTGTGAPGFKDTYSIAAEVAKGRAVPFPAEHYPGHWWCETDAWQPIRDATTRAVVSLPGGLLSVEPPPLKCCRFVAIVNVQCHGRYPKLRSEFRSAGVDGTLFFTDVHYGDCYAGLCSVDGRLQYGHEAVYAKHPTAKLMARKAVADLAASKRWFPYTALGMLRGEFDSKTTIATLRFKPFDPEADGTMPGTPSSWKLLTCRALRVAAEPCWLEP